jgi:hypothetical protein
MDKAAIVIGSLAFVLSCILAIFEWKRRRNRMVLNVQQQYLIRNGPNICILLYLAFSNSASIGRTVMHISQKVPDGLQLAHAVSFVSQQDGTITFASHSDPKIYVTHAWNPEKILQTAIDIPAYGSKSGWMPLIVIERNTGILKSPVEIELIVQNPEDKILCTRKCKLIDSILT